MIRPIRRDDIPKVVRLHIAYMNDSLFACLGKGFLYQIYQGVLSSSRGIGYVYAEDDHIMGFIAAATHTRKLFREILRKKGYKLFLALLFQIFKNPFIGGNIFQTFSYFNKTSLPTITAELLFIAMEPRLRGQGIAKKLIGRVLTEIDARGIPKVKVTTIKDNTVVNCLLGSLNFHLERSFNLYGKVMQLYSYNLEASEFDKS